MKNKLQISIVISILMVIISILVFNYIRVQGEEYPIEIDEPWCVPEDTTQTMVDENNNTYGGYEIIGETKYKDIEVCQAEMWNEEGTTTQYFTKDNSYMVFIKKDINGNITKEFEIKQ